MKYERSSFRNLSVVFLLTLASVGCQPERKQPNFLLIVADDLGYANISSFGTSFYGRPNLDALAEDGIKFTNGNAGCPVFSLTRASIQSGKYPIKSAITDWIP